MLDGKVWCSNFIVSGELILFTCPLVCEHVDVEEKWVLTSKEVWSKPGGEEHE